MNYINPIVKSVLFIILITSPLMLNAELTGKVRKNYIQSMNDACYKNQRSNSVNSNITDKVIKQYCSCTSIFIANKLTANLVMQYENGTKNIAENVPLSKIAGEYCAAHLNEY